MSDVISEYIKFAAITVKIYRLLLVQRLIPIKKSLTFSERCSVEKKFSGKYKTDNVVRPICNFCAYLQLLCQKDDS